MIAANKKTWFDYLNICVMILLAAMVIVPMWYIFVISTSTYAGYISDPYHLIPYTFTLEHYARAFTQTKELLRSLWVTIRVTVIGTLLSMLLTTAGGYALSKDELPGRDLLFFFIILTMFFSGGLVPYYIVVRKLGLNNTLWSMILPVMMSSYNLILMKNYFLTLPPSLEEAARIDGYQDIQILFKIVLPISTPVLAAIALFYGVGYWNGYFEAYLFVSSAKLWPFQMYLRDLTLVNANAVRTGATSGPMVQESYKMAIVVIGIVPVLIIYPFVQKYFATGIILGAVKE